MCYFTPARNNSEHRWSQYDLRERVDRGFKLEVSS